MVNNPKWQKDVVTALLGGMDSGNDPDIVGAGTVSRLRNISVRGGRARSRPRIVKCHDLPAGKIQGAAVFSDRNVLLVSLEGRIYELNPLAWTRVEKTSDTDRNNPNCPRHYYCETVGSIVIQDEQSIPIIYDGDEFRRADENKDEVPVGAMMSFSNGRLAVAVNNRRAVRIGDIRQDEHQSELKFTETYSLLGGGDFAFPSRVTSLTSLPVIDTSTGQGSTIVGCRGRIFSLKTQITSRDAWPDVGFQSEVFPDVGVVGHRAISKANQDLIFRAHDGLRTFRATVSDYESFGLTPISREFHHRMSCDEESFLDDTCIVTFDNRVIFTHSPTVYGNRYINLGLGSYNLDTMSRAGQKSNAVFDGEWDGLQVAEMVTGKLYGSTRCFIIGRDVDGNNGIWEILPEATQRQDGDNPVQEITTAMLPGAGIDAWKALRRCDLYLSGIVDPVHVEVLFRPDRYEYWTQWDSFDVTPSKENGWGREVATYRGPLSTRTPPDNYDPSVQRYLNQGYGFQVLVRFTGRARLDQLHVFSEVILQPSVAVNVENETAAIRSNPPAGQEETSFWFPYTASPHP